MLQVSLSEKLEMLKDVMSSSMVSVIALIVLIFIGFLFITTNKHNAKESKKVYIIAYIVCIVALLIKYGTSLGKMFDYLMNNVFVLVYFPNLAVYLIAIIITNIIMWKSMFRATCDKALKVINTVAFCIIHYLLILLLSVISTNNLNVFELSSIYTNKEALSLIEISSFIFIIWIALAIIYKLVRKYQLRNKGLVLETTEEIRNVYTPPKVVERSVFITKAPLIIKTDKKIKEEKKMEVFEQQSLNLYDGMLTVEDYKLLLSMLKEQRLKESVTEIKHEEESNLVELQDLYKRVI